MLTKYFTSSDPIVRKIAKLLYDYRDYFKVTAIRWDDEYPDAPTAFLFVNQGCRPLVLFREPMWPDTMVLAEITPRHDNSEYYSLIGDFKTISNKEDWIEKFFQYDSKYPSAPSYLKIVNF